MDSDHIQISVAGGVGRIRLNRPEKLNAFTGSMREDLLGALQAAGADPGVRLVVLSGAGRGFCAGGDVRDMVQMRAAGNSPQRVLELMSTGAQIVREILSMKKLVVALVDGVAAGAGAALACACDLRVASARSRFIFSWNRLGMHPDWGASVTLPWLVGESRALEWTTTAEVVGSARAYEVGLVNKLLTDEAFEQEAEAWLDQLCQAAPVAVAETKHSLFAGRQEALEVALAREMEGQASCWQSSDCDEGILAFTEKRAPDFKGA